MMPAKQIATQTSFITLMDNSGPTGGKCVENAKEYGHCGRFNWTGPCHAYRRCRMGEGEIMSSPALNARTQPPTQEDTVTRYAPLVKKIAYYMMSRLPPSVQADDLIQAGMIGLLEALRNYDADQGASFRTYAGIRIRGAMLDEIRKSDWAPRSLHRKVRQAADAICEIERTENRYPKDAEVADRLGVPLDAYHRTVRDAAGHKLLSLDELVNASDAIPDELGECAGDPLESLVFGEFREALTKVIASLPDREQMVMSLYYDKELNLREIGAVLNLTESRICQIHGQALLRVQACMKDWREGLDDHAGMACAPRGARGPLQRSEIAESVRPD